MNKETKLAQLKSTSKVFAVIAKVLEIVCYVGAGICGAGIIATATEAFSLGFKFVEVGPEDKIFSMLSENMETKTALIIFMALLIVFLLLAAFLIRKVGSLFRNINENYSPFVPENVKLIKVIAIIFAVITFIEVGIFPAVFTGFLIWSIALLFDYGCELQNESDEIL